MRAGDWIRRRYELRAPLGSGASATAWRAHDHAHGREVALKILSAGSDPEVLHQEYARLVGLWHPHLLSVHALGRVEPGERSAFYLASELVRGETLDRFATSGGPAALLEAVSGVVSALWFLHGLGLRHGDLKPSNVLVEPDGRAVLIDLGCASPLGVASATLSGTWAYLAPELLEGRVADGRADLYALGVMLRELSRAAPSAATFVPAGLLERLLDPDPERRPRSAADVLAALGRDVPASPPPRSEPRRMLGRATELGRLLRAAESLDRAEPAPSVVVLRGAPGSGRSRLLREAAWSISRELDVLELCAPEARPVERLLERAWPTASAPRGVALALSVRDELANHARKTVLVVDDAHKLEPEQRSVLRAFARALRPEDPILLVASESSELDAPSSLSTAVEGAVTIELGPLDAEAVAAWFAEAGLSAPRTEQLAAHARRPAEIAEEISRLRGLSTDARPALGDEALAPELRRALVTIELAGFALRDDELAALDVSRTALTSLSLLGWIEATPDGVRPRPGRAATRLGLDLPSVEREALCLRLSALARERRVELGALEPAEAARWVALEAWLLAGAGSVDEAELLLRAQRSALRRAPGAAARAAKAVLLGAEPRPELGWLAELCAESASPAELFELARAFEEGAAGAHEAVGRELRARAELGRGDPDAALAALDSEGEASPRLEAVAARAALRTGDYAGALSRATRALSSVVASSGELELALVGELHELRGAAASYLGDHSLARSELAAAAGVARELAAPRLLYRALSYRAIDAYRSGDPQRARLDHREALSIAEAEGLDDAVSRASLNLATACHQVGAFGEALERYARAERLAEVLGQSDVALLAAVNQAKLLVDLGAATRARLKAERAASLAESAGQLFVLASARSIAAEALAAEGALDASLRESRAAELGFRSLGTTRELHEVLLERASALAAAGRGDEARATLEELGDLADAPGGAEIAAKLEIVRARIALASGLAEEVPQRLRGALAELEPAGHALAVVEARALVVEALAARSSPALQGELALLESAVASITSALDAELAASLRAKPLVQAALARRARERAGQELALAPSERPGPEVLERLLALYRKLATSEEPRDLLVMALDAAIELAGAERGFIVLDEPGGGLVVPVARNVDREELGKRQSRFSHSIALRAISTGEPVTTFDALEDPRFSEQRSVHAMRLRSVLAVPIRAPEGVLGALYVDNRFSRGRFDEGVVSLLLGFADHAALVLRSLRLIAELRARTAELELARARAETLAEERAREILRLESEVESRQRVLERRHDFGAIIGRSASLERLFDTLDRVVDAPVPVLVVGESGTGKELVARALHYAGARRGGPFVSINCGALPASLLEAELFGHVRGAFTGAERDREGLVVASRGGTLFLDELGELPLELQAKLLRVLQEREVRPVGSDRTLSVDFRLVTATNRDLAAEVAKKRFREDLYYRVSVVTLPLPPLRERRDDIPLLARHFVAEAARKLGVSPPELSARAMRALVAHPFPGNVRQLENAILRAVVLAESGTIESSDLGLEDTPTQLGPRRRAPSESDERRELEAALRASGWNAREAARALGISRATLYRKLERHRIERPRP